MEELVRTFGADATVVIVTAAEDVVPLAFTDDTTISYAVPDARPVNTAGDVVDVIVTGGPPPTGYAVIV